MLLHVVRKGGTGFPVCVSERTAACIPPHHLRVIIAIKKERGLDGFRVHEL
jgi:hypothetical protein